MRLEQLPTGESLDTEPTLGTRAFRGGLWQSAAQLSPYVYTLIVSVIAARILGPDRMGRQSFIAFAVLAVQTVCAAGLGSTLLRFVGELVGRGEENRLPLLFRLAWQVSGFAGAVGGAALLVVAVSGAEPTWAWIFAAVAVAAGVLHRVPGTFLIAMQRWRAHAIIMLVTGAASVVATIVVLALGGGISGMLGVIAAAPVVMLVWTTLLARRLVNTSSSKREPLGSLRSSVLTFALASTIPVVLSLVVFQRSELFFLERFSSDAQIALYSIAFSATAGLVAVPAAIGSVLTPSVASLVGSSDFERIRRSYSRVLRLGLLFALPLTAAAVALGPELLRLVYGQRYAGAGNIFLLVVATVPLVPLTGASTAVLTGFGRIRLPIAISAVAAALDIGLAAVLVRERDAAGAAIANTAAFLVAAVMLVAYARHLVGGLELNARSLVRITVVSAAAAGLARLVLLTGDSGWTFAAATAVEAVVLSVASAALRVVPEDDAVFLIRAAGGHHRVARVLQRLSDRDVRLAA